MGVRFGHSPLSLEHLGYGSKKCSDGYPESDAATRPLPRPKAGIGRGDLGDAMPQNCAAENRRIVRLEMALKWALGALEDTHGGRILGDAYLRAENILKADQPHD